MKKVSELETLVAQAKEADKGGMNFSFITTDCAATGEILTELFRMWGAAITLSMIPAYQIPTTGTLRVFGKEFGKYVLSTIWWRATAPEKR